MNQPKGKFSFKNREVTCTREWNSEHGEREVRMKQSAIRTVNSPFKAVVPNLGSTEPLGSATLRRGSAEEILAEPQGSTTRFAWFHAGEFSDDFPVEFSCRWQTQIRRAKRCRFRPDFRFLSSPLISLSSIKLQFRRRYLDILIGLLLLLLVRCNSICDGLARGIEGRVK